MQPVTDPRQSDHCWSMAEVCTPDATLHDVACGRGRHRWGKHRNRHVRWSCPPRCVCVRHRHTTQGADPMTDPSDPPICQWCRHPITETPTWWDGAPQCPDPHACTRRIPKGQPR